MFAEQLAKRASEEWEFFGKDEAGTDHTVGGIAKEAVEPYASRIANYWLSISEKEYSQLVKTYAPGKGKLDGTVRELPWSAAFISYNMQMAGAGNEFPYSPGHATWIVKSIKNLAAKKVNAPIVGYRPGEMVVDVGDLVGAPRGAKGISYGNAVAKGWFPSHTDIVVSIDKTAKRFHTIGGNVNQSVARKTYKLNNDGKIADGSDLVFHIKVNIKGGLSASIGVG